ncbi:MAG: Vitamin B12 transporter BtuB [Gemmatimonadaceae bacterium]|nr:Vitamin B12 transporter BtuB [Gemmatimonadaceae bacterium]
MFDIRLRWFAPALLATLLAQPAAAQTGTIAGKITDAASGAPIVAARVVAQTGADRTVAATNSREDGTYRLVNVPPGTYTVAVVRIGFAAKRTENVQVTAGGTAAVDVQMSEVVTELNPVVTSASRREEKALDAPASVAVIDVRDIQERVATTVANQVEGLPGVDVSRNGVAANAIVARGFNNAFSGSILMLQDYRFAGVPSLRVNVPFLSTSTNEDVERVEVLLGPASALYGPNSSHGVLHVLTKSPFTSQGTTLTVDGGTRSLFRGGFRHAGLINQKVGYKFSGEYFTATDWEYKDPAEPPTFPASAPAGRAGTPNNRNYDLERMAGEARVDIRPTDNSEFVSTVGMTRVGSGMEFTGANGTALIKNWTYTSLQQRARIGRLFAQVFANLSDAGNSDGSDLSGTYLLRSGQPIVDKSRVFAAQIQHGIAFGDGRQDFVYGFDFIKTNPRTAHTINGRNEDVDDVRELGGYVQSTTKLSSMWDFIAALRLDNNDQIDGSQFSPRVALVFKPSQTQNFRVTFNRAFSTPANFSYFLDLIQAANLGGLGYNIRAVGNPPKQGWTFNRSCNAAVSGGLCMRTFFAGAANAKTWLPATSTAALPGLINGNAAALTAGISGALQAAPANLPKPNADAIAAVAVNYLKTLAPTPTQVGTRLAFLSSSLSTNLAPSEIQDIAPLKASFNNTYEFGYKGIIGNRLRIAADFWTEKRGDVGNPAGLATPTVYADSTTLANYLAQQLGPVLANVPGVGQLAPVLAAGIGRSVANTAKVVPLGIVSFNSDAFASATDIYATYTSYNKELTVNGLDVATDYVASNKVTLSASYSWVSKLVFDDIRSSNGLALMLNAPNHKATAAFRFRDDAKGWGFDIRGRYFNGFPVNSGVYATDFNFPSPTQAGQFYRYESIHSSGLVDVGFNWRLPFTSAREFMWSINADNLLNHGYRTLPGAPLLGRMIMSRVQYAF